MAVKKLKNKIIEPVIEEKNEEVKAKKCCSDKWMTVSWTLLLIAGLGHMMPTQLAPIFNWGVYGVNLQMAIGVGSVIAALYYLLEE